MQNNHANGRVEMLVPLAELDSESLRASPSPAPAPSVRKPYRKAFSTDNELTSCFLCDEEDQNGTPVIPEADQGYPLTNGQPPFSRSPVPPPIRHIHMSDGEKHPIHHVKFGESRSAPSSPVDKQRPERHRWMTGEWHRRSRRVSRQLTASMHHGTRHTLGRMRHVSEAFSAVGPDDENPERGTWNSQIEFFLSCLGYAVGLGNVWRFPYLCHKNGGGAFLIPYFLSLIFCGLPILVLELAIGQYASQGPITIWGMSPLFKGIGCGMVLISTYLAIYYNMVTGWGIYYIYQSLTTSLPWRCCQEPWASGLCRSTDPSCPDSNTTKLGRSLVAQGTSLLNATDRLSGQNVSLISQEPNYRFPSDDFFHNVVLRLSDSISDIGSSQPHLVLCLLIAWTLVFVVLMRGIKSIGKTVYFTSTFPYVILTILLIRTAIEPGAGKGIAYFLTPKWERLGDAAVWGDAVTQIFFSTSICIGGIITLASYNRFTNNCYRDALIIGVGNSATSIFSGFVVFSILGFMAERQGAKIEDIVKGGPGLTFIVYPEAVTLLPASPLWSTMFFLMLVTLALSSMFPTVENITTAIIDQFNHLRPYKFWVTFVTCFSLFLCGLLLTTRGGLYVLEIVDRYAVSYALVYIGICEIFVFACLYGTKRIMRNIECMTGIALGNYWRVVWLTICPGMLVFCLIFTWVDYEPLSYQGKLYPAWTNYLGWFLSLTSFAFVPGCAIYIFIKHKAQRNRAFSNCTDGDIGMTINDNKPENVGFFADLGRTLWELATPSPDFGPGLEQNRHYEDSFDADDVFDSPQKGNPLAVHTLL